MRGKEKKLEPITLLPSVKDLHLFPKINLNKNTKLVTPINGGETDKMNDSGKKNVNDNSKRQLEVSQVKPISEVANPKRGKAVEREPQKEPQEQNIPNPDDHQKAAEVQKQEKKEKFKFDKSPTKESICSGLIGAGYAQAFADFFYITHERTPQYIQPSKKYESEMKDNRMRLRLFNHDEKSLKELEAELKEIDENIRVLDAYKKLAKKFTTDYDEYHVSTYFYKKIISLAEKLKNREEIAYGNLGFARCEDKFDRPDEAIEYLRTAKEHAKGLPINYEVCEEIIGVYQKMAQRFESDDSSPDSQDKALNYYLDCLNVCHEVNDKSKEGYVVHKIGQIHFRNGDYEKALHQQEDYLKIANELNDDAARKRYKMEALAALAQCYMKLNDNDKAMEYLREYEKMTTDNPGGDKSEQMVGQKADAEKHLANLYWKKNEKDQALTLFNQYFNDAKADKQANGRYVLNHARISLALAKGSKGMEQYISMVAASKDNIYDLVDSKFQKDKK